MEHFEKRMSSKEIYSGKILKLTVDEVELENGGTAIREVVRHSGGVAVLALDDDNNIIFVRQFRYPYAEVLLELPAGKINEGEDAYTCGFRELEEETGYVAGTFEFLAEVYPTPGYTDEVLHLYTARNLTRTEQRLDADEFLTAEKIPYKKAVEMCLNGEIKDAKTLAAILIFDAKS